MPIACPGFPPFADVASDEGEDKPSQQYLHVIVQLIVKMFVLLEIVKKELNQRYPKRWLAH